MIPAEDKIKRLDRRVTRLTIIGAVLFIVVVFDYCRLDWRQYKEQQCAISVLREQLSDAIREDELKIVSLDQHVRNLENKAALASKRDDH